MARSALAVIVVMLMGGVATSYYFHRAQAKPVVGPPPYGVYPELRTVGNTVTAPGNVRLQVGAEVRVGSQLSGIVKKLYVTVGSHVEADQVIAEIDDTSIRAKVAQAEAQAELDRVAVEQSAATAKRDDQLGSQGLIPVQQQQDPGSSCRRDL
ncbi:MAG: biotin/lipoyl-binding protein [Terracidiphilus sp.]